MHAKVRALLFVLFPFVISGLLVAAWHLDAYALLLPLGLTTLLFPASFGYAAILLLEPRVPQERNQRYKPFVVVLCIAAVSVAYACSLYGTGSVLNLIPEYYKFGGSVVSLSQSTVQLWACLTVATLIVAFASHKLASSSSLTNRLALAALGMSVSTISVFVPLLASHHVVFRQ